MSLKDKTIVVTGGSRGLGLGLVEALVDQGAKVTVVARDQAALAAVEQRLGIAVIPADITDEGAAQRILADVRPEVLALDAGAKPRMGRLDQLSWSAFTASWETDVKAGLYWMQAALNLPLAPGARVLGAPAAQRSRARRSPAATPAPSACSGSWPSTPMGSPSRRGWASASRRLCLSRSSAGPGGDEGASAYARAMGVERDAFLARSGAPTPPRQFGDHLVAVLDDPQYATGFAFGLKGDTGITVLEGEEA